MFIMYSLYYLFALQSQQECNSDKRKKKSYAHLFHLIGWWVCGFFLVATVFFTEILVFFSPKLQLMADFCFWHQHCITKFVMTTRLKMWHDWINVQKFLWHAHCSYSQLREWMLVCARLKPFFLLLQCLPVFWCRHRNAERDFINSHLTLIFQPHH